MKKQVLSAVLVGLAGLSGLSSQGVAVARSRAVRPLPVRLVQFHMVSATVGWAVGQGDIWYTTNGAGSWRQVSPPHFMNSKG